MECSYESGEMRGEPVNTSNLISRYSKVRRGFCAYPKVKALYSKFKVKFFFGEGKGPVAEG